MRARYHTTTPGIFAFPLVFVLTFGAAVGEHPSQFMLPVLRNRWVFVHISLVLAGYAALLFSFGTSILYLVGERGLKSKTNRGLIARLPALEVIDQIGYRSLLLGFPFMTLGLIVGAALAEAKFGSAFFHDPKVLLSLLMWAVYMVLLLTRWNAGWRGRRAALLASVAFLSAIGVWAANYISNVHRFMP
jgi:ABC-type transport system involved in cytochrome c biogenesis permease subunit